MDDPRPQVPNKTYWNESNLLQGNFMKHHYLESTLAKNELRLLRVGDVIELTKLSKSYVYALAAEGRFPKSIPLVPGGTSRAWVYSEVQDYINQRIADRDQETGNE
jgi:prophage regulatory protein